MKMFIYNIFISLQVVEFWSKLLQTPVPAVLQTTLHSAVRATTCDTIPYIGYQAFENLPVSLLCNCHCILMSLLIVSC